MVERWIFWIRILCMRKVDLMDSAWNISLALSYTIYLTTITYDLPIEKLIEMGDDNQMKRYSCRKLQATGNDISFTLYVGLLCPPYRVSKAISAVILRIKIRLKRTQLSPIGNSIHSLRTVLCD